MLPVARLWQPDVVHYEGTVVAFDGATFQAVKDTGRDPHSDDWICLATAGRDGRDGVDGRSMRVRGTYRADENYAALDIVALNGASFIARPECPGEGWQLMSMPGKRGQHGPRGERGPAGPSGATIKSWEIDERYRATALLSDGRAGPTLDLRPFFERFHIELFEHIHMEAR
jgi:hypothetical protein